MKNFFLANSYFLFSGKVNLEKMKNDYHFNEMYILSIKNDLDFLVNSPICEIFEAEKFSVGDPFLLSISEYPNEKSNKRYYKTKKLKEIMNKYKEKIKILNKSKEKKELELYNKLKEDNNKIKGDNESKIKEIKTELKNEVIEIWQNIF